MVTKCENKWMLMYRELLKKGKGRGRDMEKRDKEHSLQNESINENK